MNRRSFIQSLAAVVSLPANPLMSLRPVAAAIPVVADVPVHVRSWAVYMSNLHGECTPLTLHRLLQTPEIDAKKYVGRLIADGVLKPNPVLQEVAQRFARPPKDNLPDQAESPLERATQAHSEQLHLPQDNRETGGVDTKADLPEGPVEADRAIPDASQPLANPEEPEPPQYPSSSPLIT